MKSKFRPNEEERSIGQINTASLPDIIFMLLFFFMVTTVMREVDLKVNIHVPEATQAKKLEKKSLVSFIYVGKPLPRFQKMFGTEPRIQLNDQFRTVRDIQDFIAQEKDQLNEADRNKLTVSLKVDENTQMGIVSDIKQSLRRANALKISYSSVKTDKIR
ncbi:MAG: biopolymer transporter ExbD [Bacteroidales bacterium]|nr:biopolymer transporter ExbD [Bacteroidales bacterium]